MVELRRRSRNLDGRRFDVISYPVWRRFDVEFELVLEEVALVHPVSVGVEYTLVASGLHE